MGKSSRHKSKKSSARDHKQRTTSNKERELNPEYYHRSTGVQQYPALQKTMNTSAPYNNGEGNSAEESSSNGGISSVFKQKKVVVAGAALLVTLFAIAYWKMRSGKSDAGEADEKKTGKRRSKANKKVRWADEDGQNLEATDGTDGGVGIEDGDMNDEAGDAQFLRQEERMQAARDLESKLVRIDQVKAKMNDNQQKIKQVQDAMNERFGDNAAGYDEGYTAFEQEQSLENAFMMKKDLDDSRQNMIKYAEELKKDNMRLIDHGNHVDQEYKQGQERYRQMYGTHYVPQRHIGAPRRQIPQGGPPGGGPPMPPHGPPPGQQGSPPGFPPRQSPPPGTPMPGSGIPQPPPGYDMNMHMARQQPMAMAQGM